MNANINLLLQNWYLQDFYYFVINTALFLFSRLLHISSKRFTSPRSEKANKNRSENSCSNSLRGMRPKYNLINQHYWKMYFGHYGFSSCIFFIIFPRWTLVQSECEYGVQVAHLFDGLCVCAFFCNLVHFSRQLNFFRHAVCVCLLSISILILYGLFPKCRRMYRFSI